MLSGPELRDEIGPGRLVIDPPIGDLDNLGVAIDLTLHDIFWRSALPRYRDVDIVVGLDADPYEFMQPEELPELVLSPGEFVLAETAESIGIPLDLCGWIEGKSGRARLGLEVHLRAPKIDPGSGIPTTEADHPRDRKQSPRQDPPQSRRTDRPNRVPSTARSGGCPVLRRPRRERHLTTSTSAS